MVDNSLMRSKTRSTQAPLSQAIALAMVVSWSVCALAEASATSTMLTLAGGSQRLGNTGQQGELRSIEQWKGHLKLAARQFRFHPAPDWWLTHFAPCCNHLTTMVDPRRGDLVGTIDPHQHQHTCGLQRLLAAHHVNLPPPLT